MISKSFITCAGLKNEVLKIFEVHRRIQQIINNRVDVLEAIIVFFPTILLTSDKISFLLQILQKLLRDQIRT